MGSIFFQLCQIIIQYSKCENFLIPLLSLLLIFFYFLKISLIMRNLKKMEKNIHKIVINNLNNIDEDKILRNINVKVGQSFWNFNSKKLANDLKKLEELRAFLLKWKMMEF